MSSDSVIIDLPFAFAASHKPPQSREIITSILKASTPVRIRMMGSADAPIAVRLIAGQDKTICFRSFEGRLFQRLAYGEPLSAKQFESEALAHQSFELGAAGGARRWSESRYPLFANDYSYICANFLRLPAFDMSHNRSSVGEVIEDDRSSRLAEAQRRLGQDMVEIDGDMWVAMKGGEPCLIVSYGYFDNQRTRVTLTWSEGGADLRSSKANAFRLDRMEDARRFAEELAVTRKTSMNDDYLPRVDFIEAGALCRDDGQGVAFQMMGTAVEIAKGDNWSPLSRNKQIKGFADKRDRADIDDYVEIISFVTDWSHTVKWKGGGLTFLDRDLKMQVDRIRDYEMSQPSAVLDRLYPMRHADQAALQGVAL